MPRLVLLFAIVLGTALTAGHASAASGQMKVSPASQIVLDGTAFTTDVLQNADAATAGAQTDISFNPALVMISTVQAGEAYAGAAFLMGVAPQTHQEAIDEANVTGTLQNVSLFFSPGAGSVPQGEKTFVRLNLQAKPGVEGISAMTLSELEMLDDGFNNIPVTPVNGGATVCLDNTDGDALCNSGDPDDDNDGVTDAAETPCGSNPLDVTPPLSRPERVDGIFAGVDDDGDTQMDEALAGGAANFDCDGDGYKGSVEDHVFSYLSQTNGDQKVCQEYDATFPNGAAHIKPSKRWPSDIASSTFSLNKINTQDLSSFVTPVRYLSTNVGAHQGDVRFDLVPGSPTGPHINISDMAALTAGATGSPTMLGVRAFGGPVCPYAP